MSSNAFKEGKKLMKISVDAKLFEIPYDLIYVRHGQSKFKPEMASLGTFDLSLTPLGIQQSEKAAEDIKYFVKKQKLDGRVGPNFERIQIFCSPLKRTKETAEVIQERLGIKRKIVFLEDLQEYYFGDFVDGKLVGMETRENFRRRTTEVVKKIGELMKKEKEKVFPVFVAHGKVWKYQWNVSRKLDFAEVCFLDTIKQEVVYKGKEKDNYDYQHSYCYKNV